MRGRGETPVHGVRGPVANGINTVHLSYVREGTGHALAGARQWIPREHIEDPVTSLIMGLPLALEFRTKGQLATDICADCYADGPRHGLPAAADQGNRQRRSHPHDGTARIGEAEPGTHLPVTRM